MSAPLHCKVGFLMALSGVRVVVVSVFWETASGSHRGNAEGVQPHSSPLSPPTLLPPSSCHVAVEHTSYSLETFKPYFAWLCLWEHFWFYDKLGSNYLFFVLVSLLPCSLPVHLRLRFLLLVEKSHLTAYFTYLPSVFPLTFHGFDQMVWERKLRQEGWLFSNRVRNLLQSWTEFYKRLPMQINNKLFITRMWLTPKKSKAM